MISPSDFTGALGCFARYAGEVELELVADHAALAQQIVEARHGDVDHLGALRLHAVERLADDAGDFVVFAARCPRATRSTPMRAPFKPSATERVAIRLRECGRRSSLVIASAGSAPTVASSMIARSVTVRASGPAMSCVDDSGITPLRLDRPCVPRRPTRFWFAAGMRIDPQVSLPMPAAAKLAPIAAPVPPLDPPGTRYRSYGLRVWPVSDEIVVMPARELVHRRLAENHRAGVAQLLHLKRVGRRLQRGQRRARRRTSACRRCRSCP